MFLVPGNNGDSISINGKNSGMMVIVFLLPGKNSGVMLIVFLLPGTLEPQAKAGGAAWRLAGE